MEKPFLNVDAGELEDEPEELFAVAHVVNLACGGHAGDDASIDRALARARRHGARVGAHPSYPDRAGFGRVAMDVAPAEARAFVAAQCARLVARSNGARVDFVKAHGALYHAANRDRALAEALVGAAIDALGAAVTVIGPPRGPLSDAAARAGLRFAREGFADRGARPDGSLVPRGEPGAMIEDPRAAADAARSLAQSGTVDTVCVHGDTKGAVAIARAVRAALDA